MGLAVIAFLGLIVGWARYAGWKSGACGVGAILALAVIIASLVA
jgi:hypothetical protein